MPPHKKQQILRRFFFLFFLPLLFSFLLSILVTYGLFSLPLLAGFTGFSLGAIVFGMTALASITTACMLWMLQISVQQYTKNTLSAYACVTALVLLGTISTIVFASFAPATSFLTGALYLAPLGPIISSIVVGMFVIASLALLLTGLTKTLYEIQKVRKKPSLSLSSLSPASDTKKPLLLPTPTTISPHSKSPSFSSIPPHSAPTSSTIRTLAQIAPTISTSTQSVISMQEKSEEELLPDPPFSKKDKRTANYSLERQWSIDRDLLETFFTSLCQQVLQQVDTFPEKKATLLDLAQQKIKACLQALIARYHPDKAEKSEKDFLQNNILHHPLFTSSGEALYLVIQTYDPLNFAAALNRLIQGMQEILQDYKRISKISEQTIQDATEISRSMNEVAEGYIEIQQATIAAMLELDKVAEIRKKTDQMVENTNRNIENIDRTIARMDPIIKEGIETTEQATKDARAIASDMHEANEKMDEILQTYVDVIQSQNEEEKKLAKCREGIEQLGIRIQECAQHGAQQFADLNKSLEETQKFQQQQWGMLLEIVAANQAESLLEGDIMAVPAIEEDKLLVDSLLREQESFSKESSSSHQEVSFS